MAVDGHIVVRGERRERPEAVTDLTEGQVAVIADALSYYERMTCGGPPPHRWERVCAR